MTKRIPKTKEEADLWFEVDLAKAKERHGKRLDALANPPGQRREENKPRYLEALKLRREGLTYARIGKHFGVSVSRAQKMVELAERRIKYGKWEDPWRQ